MLSSPVARCVSALTILLLPWWLSATQIRVVDEQGMPVSGAVIGLTGLESNVSAASLSKPAIMDQINYQFVPQILVIDKGQWVDFPNGDNVRHHIYSFSSPNPFEVKMFSGSEAPLVQFTNPGIVVLGCNINDSMVGYVYVADASLTLISNEAGVIDIPVNKTVNNKEQAIEVGLFSATLWHPLLSAAHTKRIDISIDLSLSSQIIKLPISQLPQASKTIKKGFSSKFKGLQ